VRPSHSGRLFAALGAAVLAACSDSAEVRIPAPPQGATILQRYVALGNSLTAGYQSGGINDSTQREAYPYLIAQQAGIDYDVVYIPKTCLPPLVGFNRLPVNPPGPCVVAEAPAFVNNVAVPNSYAADLGTAYPATAVVPLTSFIRGGRSQVRRALDANPTFVSIWLGNNEVLAPASTGVLTPVPGASPGRVPPNTIIANIAAGIDTLSREGRALRGGVLIGMVDVVNAPRLFAATSLFSGAGYSAVKAGLDRIVDSVAVDGTTVIDRTVQVLPNCATSDALISSVILEQIKTGAYPPVISCTDTTITGIPPTAAIGNLFILSAQERGTLSGDVAAVNTYLQAKADTIGWAYFDPNNSTNGLPALKAAGAIFAVPDFTNPVAPFGPYMSTDGVHPRLPAHRELANAIIAAINGQYGTTVPTIAP
jgi:hypothetical protein